MRCSDVRSAVLAVLIVASSAAPAAADAPWSAPRALPGPVIGLGATGSTALVASGVLAPGAASRDRRARTAIMAINSAGPPRATRVIAGSVVAGPTVSSRASTVLRTRLRSDGRRTLEAAAITSGGSVQTSRLLTDDWDHRVADVAGRGDSAAMVWTQRRRGRVELLLVERSQQGRYSRPVVVLRARAIRVADVALGQDGTLAIAAERLTTKDNRIVARVRAPGGRLGPVDDLASSLGASQLASAVDQQGRAYVAYVTQDGGEEANRPAEVGAAVRPPGRPARFGARQMIDSIPAAFSRVLGIVSLAVGDGRVALSWSSTRQELNEPSVGAVRAAFSQQGAAFRDMQDVPGLDGAVGRVVSVLGGFAVASQTTATAEDQQPILAAYVLGGTSSFLPAGQVSDAATLGDSLNPRAPYVTASGPGVMVAWNDHFGKPHYAIRPLGTFADVPPA